LLGGVTLVRHTPFSHAPGHEVGHTIEGVPVLVLVVVAVSVVVLVLVPPPLPWPLP
jgi:hypothetical protein